MRLGAHLSIAKGLPQTAETAREIGANTFQFFTRNPRGDIFQIVGHLPYTVNMAAREERPYNFAKLVIAEELQRMDAAGVEYLVIHPGSHTGAGAEKGIERIAACLEEVFLPHRGQIMLLLETMAGRVRKSAL